MPYLIHDYMNVNNTAGSLPSPDAFLFNDTTSGPAMEFKPKKRYLLRIVNHSALSCGQFHIDNHKLTVVAVDGQGVEPVDTDTIMVCAGQSYDVIVTGQRNPLGSAQYIAKMVTDMLTGDIPSDAQITVIGKVEYQLDGTFLSIGNLLPSPLSPSWTPSSSAILDDITLTPLDNEPLLTEPKKLVNFYVNQTYYEGIGTRIAVGNEPWTEPKVPTLYTALTTGKNAWDASTYGPGVAPEILKSNEVVQIYLENAQSFPHPMHLHVSRRLTIFPAGTNKKRAIRSR